VTDLALKLHGQWKGQPSPLTAHPPQLPAPTASAPPALLPLLPQGRSDSLIRVKNISKESEKGKSS